ncbi:MAG: hypothetical protein H7X75_08940 [Burkholderiaceae bacterium]|nr:hypothetical protein [Burkholderiaceae bacterium]
MFEKLELLIRKRFAVALGAGALALWNGFEKRRTIDLSGFKLNLYAVVVSYVERRYRAQAVSTRRLDQGSRRGEQAKNEEKRRLLQHSRFLRLRAHSLAIDKGALKNWHQRSA